MIVNTVAELDTQNNYAGSLTMSIKHLLWYDRTSILVVFISVKFRVSIVICGLPFVKSPAA